MNSKYLYSLVAIIVLFLVPYIGVGLLGMKMFFGYLIPYAAILIFFYGFIRKILDWSHSPVPFCIPTTGGQQKTLTWIPDSKLDNPTTTAGVIARMALEILCFRSLFRNTKFRLKGGGSKLTYYWEIFLWVGALAFHWAFLVTIVRHLRLFTEPVPFFVKWLEFFDGFVKFEIVNEFFAFGLPGIYISGLVLLAAVIYLLLRRIIIDQVNYVSQAADFFPLFLIGGIALTGIFMRYLTKVDIVGVKELTMGMVTFRWSTPDTVSTLFYVHLFFVCVLLAYFPFSKLMHLGGIFFSPTRNLTTDTRAKRHVNPWNYPVHVHTYEEYEEEFRDKMIEAGLPVEKESD